MISPEKAEEIRQKADIVQIISSFIKVYKKGSDYVAVCPFHNDTNPSMHISPSKQIFKCFVCNEGGNVFNFVSKYEKISYYDAVAKVAEMIGITDLDYKKQEREIAPELKGSLNALKEATDLYKYLLNSKDGEKCLEYLRKRNISPEMQEYFDLGYSSLDETLSIKLLQAKGISIEDLDNSGILSRYNGQFIDRFSGRLIFPIYNEYSEVIGYSARIITKNDEAKYINTKETPLFNKSQVLYNYQNAKKESKREGYVYVTEGFMDVFALYKIGIKSTIALMGTAFTQYHAKLLRKLNVQVRLCLDGDNAGQHGMYVASEMLEKEGIPYKIVDYKDVILDPDEILQQFGENRLKQILNQLIDRNEFVGKYFAKQSDLSTNEGKKKYAELMIPVISNIDNPIDKDLLIKDVCFKTGISVDTYYGLIGQKTNTSNNRAYNNTQYYPNTTSYSKNGKMKINKLKNIQDELLYHLLCFKETIKDMEESGCYFIDDIYERIRNYVVDRYQTKGEDYSPSPSETISMLSQTNDEKKSEMISAITEVVSKKNYKTYDKEMINETISAFKVALEEKEHRDFLSSLMDKSNPEKAELYIKDRNQRKGEK